MLFASGVGGGGGGGGGGGKDRGKKYFFHRCAKLTFINFFFHARSNVKNNASIYNDKIPENVLVSL